jgi:DNA repair photolyase
MPKKPVFGTSEWAAHNANILLGCQHDCRYCYAKAMAMRFGRATPESWSTPVLNTKAYAAKRGKKTGTIMFPTTHDIHPDNLTHCLQYLQKLLVAGNDVLVVTKPHKECIDKLTAELGGHQKQILFRFTIGTVSTSTLKFWEPGAPSVDERLTALELAHSRGFQTSISSEPMLGDVLAMVGLFEVAKPFITNSHWMGKANDLLKRLKFNGQEDPEVLKKAQELIDYWTDDKVMELYNKLKTEPTIRWKESIKKVVGLEIPTKKGMDI